MSRTLVVIGSGQMQVPVYQLAREMGITTIGLDRDPNSPGRPLAGAWYPCDISDEEACLQCVLDLGRPVHGVLTVGTDFSTTVARLTEALGLPGHRYEAAWNARDKERMRRVLRFHGVPVPDFLAVSEPQPPPGIALPAVVKPVDNMGARGVRRVDQPEDWGPALAEALRHSRRGRALVERYVDGPEFSLDALLTPRGFYRRGLADRDIRFPPNFVELGHAFPSRLNPVDQEALWQCLEAAARALGLSWGAVKGDLKWEDGQAVVGEVAARLSGGFMSGWTYPLASGRQVVREAITLALGEEPADHDVPPVRGVVEGAILALPGVLRGWEGVDRIRELEGVAEVFLQRRPGETVVFPRNNVEKAANVIAVGPKREDAEAVLREARRILVPRLEPHQVATEEWLSRPLVKAFTPAGQDWYGVEWEERLEDLARYGGPAWSRLSPSQRRLVLEALEAGGLVGALYRLDCLTSA